MTIWPFSPPLAVGAAAPDFSLLDDTGRLVTLSALRGRSVVLVFYPGDDTPGCTKQLCQLRDNWDDAVRRGVAIYGVNPQSLEKHAKFRAKFKFPFPLLVDRERKVASLYQANGLIVKRTVYLIGPDGVIRFAKRGMPAPQEVMAAAPAAL